MKFQIGDEIIDMGCIKNVPVGMLESIVNGDFLANSESTEYTINVGDYHLKGCLPTPLALRITGELIPKETFEDPERRVSVYERFFVLGRPQYNMRWPDGTRVDYYSWN